MANLKARRSLSRKFAPYRGAMIARATRVRDGAIKSRALKLRIPGEDAAELTGHVIELWNGAAEWLDRAIGFGLRAERTNAFSLRFKPLWPDAGKDAFAKLCWICDVRPFPDDPQMPVFDIMFDLMLAGSLSEKTIEYEATARDGAWWRRIRKQVGAKQLRDAVAAMERDADILEDQRERAARIFRQELLAKHNRLFGGDHPTLADSTVRLPHEFRGNMLVPVRPKGRKLSPPDSEK